MSQSLAKVVIHLVFSTKHRRPFIAADVREELASYVTGVLRNLDSPAMLVRAVEDHMHILFCLSRNHAIKTIVEEVKKSSSKWIKTKGPSWHGFSWQAGYGAFSVSQSAVVATRRYIADQEQHHRRATFQEEFRRFLERYQVPFDERYVWD